MKRTKIYDEKTGNPCADNKARKINTILHRAIDKTARSHNKGRKNRARLLQAAFPYYADAVATAAEEMALEKKGLQIYPAQRSKEYSW